MGRSPEFLVQRSSSEREAAWAQLKAPSRDSSVFYLSNTKLV